MNYTYQSFNMCGKSKVRVTLPLNFSGMTGNPDHFLNYGLGAIPGSAAGKAWTGENVFNSATSS